ncbi:MAG: iron ABC transporter permease [Marinovum sp.]|nr:iron ABC transporter permease [Marinovum sp.]
MRVFFGLWLVLLGAVVVSLCSGDINVSPGVVFVTLVGSGQVGAMEETIVNTLRLPRVCLAVTVGAALGLAGTTAQAILRNPLAEPGLLGINAGAGLAAMLVIVQVSNVHENTLPLLTFYGALLTCGAIWELAGRVGITPLRLILVGVGLGALTGAGASFIATFAPPADAMRAMIWVAGSLQDAGWVKLGWVIYLGVPGAVLVALLARDFDILVHSDNVARALGQRVNVVRSIAILAIALLAGGAVAGAGPIAFVGLAAPHMARALVGYEHRNLLPASAILGAILLVLADLAARRTLAPIQVPVGLATALIGAPFLGYLLWRLKEHG